MGKSNTQKFYLKKNLHPPDFSIIRKTKLLLLSLLAACLLMSNSSSKKGYIIDYDFTGKVIGSTGARGNMKVYYKQNKKRVDVDLVFKEPGKSFATIDKRNLIVDHKEGTKLYYTSDIDNWFKSDFNANSVLIQKTNKRVNVKGARKEIDIKIILNPDPDTGSSKKYLIKIVYLKGSTRSEIMTFLKYVRPSAVEFLSIFFDNEKLSDVLNSMLGSTRYRIPDKFSIAVYEDDIEIINLNGKLKAKMVMELSDKEFTP